MKDLNMMKLSSILATLVIMVILNSCISKEKADLILVSGKIYTTDSAFSIKEALAVSNGNFIATGTNEEILSAYSSEIIVDAGGKVILPGLIDGHCHFFGYAQNRYQGVNLRGTSSFEEIVDKLKDFHSLYPEKWITGTGWDQNDWNDKAFPDNLILNTLFPDIPVILTRIDGHAVLANACALHLARIDSKTVIPGGKVLLKDGKPTGMLLDNAADSMKKLIPAPDQQSRALALQSAQEDCFRYGLTSVVDAGLDYNEIKLIDSLQNSGHLKIRINAMLSPTDKNIREFLGKGSFRKERLTVNSLKLYADGALGSRGALLLEPYADDPGNYGVMVADESYYRELLSMAYNSGFQVNTHCIGDSANRMILNLYREVLNGPNDRRWRIEHAQVVNPGDFRLFGDYRIIPSVQATHCTSDMYWAGERLGPDRIKYAYAYKKLLDENGWIINGTDFPIEEVNPMLTFFASTGRMDKSGYPENGFQTENALSREETLRSMTIWAAKGSFEDDIKGSIEPGKVADFVILDRDIMEVPFPEIPKTVVLKTYLNGELVFEN